VPRRRAPSFSKDPFIEVQAWLDGPGIHFQAFGSDRGLAVFGTIITPYLLFWQASQEVEEQRASKGEKPLKDAPEQARDRLQRIKADTCIGMGFSNLIAFFIMLTAAVTLHHHGVKDIETSAQAAEALRPIAVNRRFYYFPQVSLAPGCLPYRFWQARPPMPWRIFHTFVLRLFPVTPAPLPKIPETVPSGSMIG
jgi:hypothetical protein